MRLRKLTIRDLPRCVSIATDIGIPMESNLMTSWLKTPSTVGWVVIEDDKVVAYLIYDVCKDGYAIYHLCVDPLYQWRGIGRYLVGTLQAKLTKKRSSIFVNIRADDEAANAFLRACGFLAMRFNRGSVRNGPEKIDGVLMAYLIEFSDELLPGV